MNKMGESVIRCGIDWSNIFPKKYATGIARIIAQSVFGFDTVLQNPKQGDIIITMGAGNVWKIGEALLFKPLNIIDLTTQHHSEIEAKGSSLLHRILHLLKSL